MILKKLKDAKQSRLFLKNAQIVYNIFVKRFLIVPIIVSSLLVLFSPSAAAASNSSIQPLAGIVISNISPESFNTKNPDVPIGLCKVEDPVSLSNIEMFAMSHNIPLYAKVNLFYYAFSSSNSADLDDLKAYYLKIPQDFLEEKDSVMSAILYGVQEDGKLLAYTEKKEPEIELTYKTTSSKQGTSVIVERHVKFNNDVVTYFLLNPFREPINNRANPFEVAKIYDIDPSFYNTLVVRQQNSNKNVNFSGFYVDMPDKFVSQSYFDIEKASLAKFASYIHGLGKNLIVENLTEGTLPLGKFGDIIGVKVDGSNFDILEKARLQFKDKIVFATYNGDFSNVQNIQVFLDQCILYGIYPEFRRDTSSGEFLYYENYFSQAGSITKDAVSKISLLNKTTFTKESFVNGAKIVQFGKYPFMFFVISYNGNIAISLDKALFDNKSDFTIADYNNGKVNFTINNNVVNLDASVNGLKLLRVVPQGFYPVYLGTFPANSSNAGANSFFINIGNGRGIINVQFKFRGYTKSETLSLNPVTEQGFYNTTMPLSVEVNGINYTTSQNKLNVNINLILLFISLALFFFLLFYRRFNIKNSLSKKVFIILSILLSITLILINSVFVHYTAITVGLFTFSLLFLITAFYRIDNFKNFLIISVLLFLMGMFYNYFEFGTLLPQVFNGLLPFRLYENLFFYLPFIISMVLLSALQGKNITRLELLIVILTLGIIMFYFDNFSLPFEFKLQIRSLYPIFALFAGNILLVLLNKPFKWGRVILSAIPLAIAFASIYLSNTAFSINFLKPEFIYINLILKDFLIYSIPFFFVSLYLYNVDKKVHGVPFGKLALTILGVLAFYNYLTQYFVKTGNPIFSSIGFIVDPILIILMLFFLIESPGESF